MQFERVVISEKFITEVMWPLLERHYKEVSAFPDIPLKPDIEKYLKMQELGTLRCFVVYDEDGELIGYQVFFVNQNLHYSGSKQAIQDILYLEKSKRGLGTGKIFIEWCDQELKKERVEVVYQHVKTYLNFGPLLESLGYKHLENIYGRRLGGK